VTWGKRGDSRGELDPVEGGGRHGSKDGRFCKPALVGSKPTTE
jgi:hypothetical protein